MQVAGIEGEALGATPVIAFTELTYGVLQRAEAAREFVSTAEHVLSELEDLGVSTTQQQQFAKKVQRCRDISEQIRQLALQGSELVPVLMQAAAFDFDLRRFNAQWKAAERIFERSHELWSKMVAATVPMARTAAGRTMYLIAVASEEGRPVEEAVPMDVLDPAAALMASDLDCLDRTDRISTRTPRDVLDGVMGTLIHLTVSTPSTMTLFPTSRPERWVRLTLGDGERMMIECAGNRDLPAGERLTADQEQHLRDLGLNPPGRRVAERHWHLVIDEFEPFGTTTAAASMLVNVHRLRQGEALTVVTAHSDADVPGAPKAAHRTPRTAQR